MPDFSQTLQIFQRQTLRWCQAIWIFQVSLSVLSHLSFPGKFVILMQSNLFKMTTVETTQEWLPWLGARLIKDLHKTTTSQLQSFCAGFYFFPQSRYQNGKKFCNFVCFGAILQYLKCFVFSSISNAHILISIGGCFTVTLSPLGSRNCQYPFVP